MFSLFLSENGEVYACGSSEAGQLGNGQTGEIKLCRNLGMPLGEPYRAERRDLSLRRLTAFRRTDSYGQQTRIQCADSTSSARLRPHHLKMPVANQKAGRVNGLEGKKIVRIASGAQHSLAMDDQGYMWTWGFAKYSRLGLESTADKCAVSHFFSP